MGFGERIEDPATARVEVTWLRNRRDVGVGVRLEVDEAVRPPHLRRLDADRPASSWGGVATQVIRQFGPRCIVIRERVLHPYADAAVDVP
eukprot:scaffold27031_cov63-Phaeocystis_antarctica.AAC.1